MNPVYWLAQVGENVFVLRGPQETACQRLDEIAFLPGTHWNAPLLGYRRGPGEWRLRRDTCDCNSVAYRERSWEADPRRCYSAPVYKHS